MPAAPLLVDRYAIYDRIAAGGMATVHLGRLVGERGFSRTVAIKRLHPHLAMDPDFVSMFLDEARLAARIRHPNVVQTLDVVVAEGEVFLVMEYIEGESLATLMRATTARHEALPTAHISALIAPVLHGLHAAHEAKTDRGEPLALVHRDVSPQNVLVGVDGVPRVLDFGVAKALGQSHLTRAGEVKGKLAYMAPEQIESRPIDRRTDVFAAGVVLWEALTGQRLFKGESDVQVMRLVLHEPIRPPSSVAPHLSPAVDQVVMCALSRDPDQRYPTAEAMADALEEVLHPTPARKLAVWVQERFNDRLMARAKLVRDIESASTGGSPRPRDSGQDLSGVGASPIIDVTGFAVEEPLAQPPSQSSSISVEAPLRASLRPRSSKVSPAMIAAGGAVCLGVAALVAATHDLGRPAPVTSVAAQPPAQAIPAPLPTPLPGTMTPPPPPVEQYPAVTPPPQATSATPPPRPTTVSNPPPAVPAPPAQRPARTPAPASTLYSRF